MSLLHKVSRLNKSHGCSHLSSSSRPERSPLSTSALHTNCTNTLHTTTTPLRLQLLQRTNELDALQKTYRSTEAQLSLAHRQLGDIATQTQRLQEETHTSKVLHIRKQKVAEQRIQAATQVERERLQHDVLVLQTQHAQELDELQVNWNEARHQLNFEREIVATQRTKIVALLQAVDDSGTSVAAERMEYETKCTRLAQIHDEQRLSLETMHSQFEQCRLRVHQEEHQNRTLSDMSLKLKQQVTRLQNEQAQFVHEQQTLQTAHGAAVVAMNAQLEEEMELRTFAQAQWDEEVERSRSLQQTLTTHQSIEVQLKQDVSGLLFELQHVSAAEHDKEQQHASEREKREEKKEKKEKKEKEETEEEQKQDSEQNNRLLQDMHNEMIEMKRAHEEDRECLMASHVEALDILQRTMTSKWRRASSVVGV